MKRVLAFLAVVGVFAGMASTAEAKSFNDNKRESVKVCRVSDNGTQTQTEVKRHELKGFLLTHPGSYVGECKAPEPTPAPSGGQVNRVGACASFPVPRVGEPDGTYVNVTVQQLASGTFEGATIVPASVDANGVSSCP